MPREVKINVNVDSGKAVSSINTLKKAFQELNKSIEKHGKDGSFKVKVDLEGIDVKIFKEISNGFSKLGKGMELFNKNIEEVTKNGNLLSITSNTITNNIDKSTKTVNNYTKSLGDASKSQRKFNDDALSSLVVLEGFRRMMTSVYTDYSKLIDTTFGVGIAGQMNMNEIEKLNQSFLTLSQVVPETATNLAKAVDDLIRTGRSYSDSRKIIEEVARLSTASGDSLKDTAQVVTKVMVSLGISGNRVKETLDTMHSTAIQTASDMGYLAEAFKNVAGTTAVFVKGTGLAGKELDDYKQRILDLSMASIGSMANLGLSASQSGTKIKQLFGRLVSAEKVAKSMFDTTMKLQNVQVGDKIFNYDMLSQMAQSDLPQAVEKMSELYKSGQLSSSVLQKMFTARHFMEISNLLIDINGDIDGFVNGIAKGVNYSNDFYKNMFNINKQMQQLKNNVFASLGEPLQNATESVTGLLMVLNEILPKSSKMLGVISNITPIIATTAGAITAVGATTRFIVPLFQAGATSITTMLTGMLSIKTVLGAITGALTGILGVGSLLVGGAFLIFKHIYNSRKELADTNLFFASMQKTVNDAVRSVEVLETRIKTTKDTLEKFGKIDIETQEIDKASSTLNELLSKYKDLYEVIQASEGWSIIDTKDSERALRLAQIQLDSVNKYIKDNIKQLEEAKSEAVQAVLDSEGMEGTIDIYGDSVEKVAKKYLELYENGSNVEENMKKITEFSKDLGINFSDLERIIKGLNSIKIDVLLKRIQFAKDKIGELSEQLQEQLKIALEQSEKNMLAYNKHLGYLAKLNMNIFEKKGEIILGGKAYGGKGNEFEALFAIFSEGNLQSIDLQIEEYKKRIDTINETNESIIESSRSRQRQLTKEESENIQNNKNEVQRLDSIINKLTEDREKLNKTREDLRATLQDEFKGIDYNKETSEYFVALTSLYSQLNEVKSEKLVNETEVKLLTEEIARNRILLKIADEQVKAKENASTYQLKLVTYTKENLQLELETEKIGKSRAEQAYLEYKYKLETLKANKSMALDDVESVKKTLKAYKIRTQDGQKYITEALKYNNPEKVQEIINSFREKHSGIITGKTGKDLKSDYDMLIQLLKVLQASKDASIKLGVALKQGIRSAENVMLSDTLNIMSKDSAKYIRPYLDKLKSELDNYKSKISTDFFNGKDFDLEESLKQSIGKIELLTLIGGDKENLIKLSDNFKSIFGEEVFEKLISSKDFTEDLALYTEKTVKENEALLEYKKKLVQYTDSETEAVLKQLEAYQSLSNLLGKMSDIFNIGIFGDLGDVLSAFKDTQSFMKDTKNKFSLKAIFNPKEFEDELGNIDWNVFADNFSKAMESVFKQLSQGSAVGNLIGGLIGGSQGASQAGAMAGIITGAMGNSLTGWQGMAIQAGASLIGGLFDKSGDDQEEAERRTKEANKIYNKNTEALQQLSQRMSELSGGVDSLNNSLVSSFSKIPTVGNLNRVTDAMTSMYKTMEKTRIFEDVAYQVTKTKKSKGFLGIGGGSTSWTETIEVSVQEMLNKYGFKGAIEDMTTDQLRDFSKWLDDYDMGDSDNFSMLADAIEDYAEALDKMEENIEDFFYDTTMESFEGISSLQQEELRQQIEDFYKNLGLQIDDAMLEQIDKLAEEMSVMVTIMQDVRGEFINSWRNSGVDAGKAFVGAMKPYVDAMLTNISQIYYDVYFSDVNKQLEDEFKSLSEKLVELKKQGQDLDWSSVAGELSDSFGDVINIINATKDETESFNTILLELQKQALESGLSLSEIFELGLTTGTQNTVIETFKEALTSSEADSAFTSIGEMVGDTIGEALVDKMIDNLLSDKILEFSAQLDKIVSGSMNFDQLAGLAVEAQSIGMMMESERLRLEAIKDLFNFDKDITYQNQDTNIEYQTGVSSQVVNNYYLSSSVEAGNVIESDSVERLADELLDIMLEKLKVDKGIDLKK